MPVYPGMVIGCRLEYVSATQVRILEGYTRTGDDSATVQVTVPLIVDITVVGAGGLASNYAESPNQLYDVWLITEAAGANPAGLLTESGDSLSTVTFPGSYLKDQSIYLGSVANITGGTYDDFMPFKCMGEGQSREMSYEDQDLTDVAVTNPLLVVDQGRGTGFIDMSLHVPPRALTSRLRYFVLNQTPDRDLDIVSKSVNRMRFDQVNNTGASLKYREGILELAMSGTPATDIQHDWQPNGLVPTAYGISASCWGYTYDVGPEWLFSHNPPTVLTFTTVPLTVDSGDPVLLTWTTSGAESVDIDGGVGTGLNPNDSATAYPATIPTTTYTLVAHGPGGDAYQTVDVTVLEPPPAACVVSDPVSCDTTSAEDELPELTEP